MLFLAESDWFAVHVKLHRERNVAMSLRAKGYEQFLPSMIVRKRGRDCEQALFPGYLFCKINANAQVKVVTTPGVLDIVRFGGLPAPVDPEEIASLQLVTRSGAAVIPHGQPQPGTLVSVEDGPFRGAVGQLQCALKNKHRLVICISLLMRAVSVEVDESWVRPLHRNGRHEVSGADAGPMAQQQGDGASWLGKSQICSTAPWPRAG